MSRVAKLPVPVPKGVDVNIQGDQVTIKGGKESLQLDVHRQVRIEQNDGELQVVANDGSRHAIALAGTTRALLANMVTGVSKGFERKLELKGVGYRAAVQGKKLNLVLGFSHPVEHEIPEGISIECPTQTEIVIKGADKQRVGQVAANIRAYRPPDAYKGKGVRYSDEQIILKEAKKK
ncbi:MAG: 50S ribosomal protein L6 [Gammaproteobacteria bacterium]|nr:50S ribosomal protein L6 [Gammaproteobacteria bacterium]NND60027.1 50S ribosomal protein L6 [Gammaproteobacteria bacterium]